MSKPHPVAPAALTCAMALQYCVRSGLDAIFDEIEEIVRRNCEEFRHDFDTVFSNSRDDLTEARRGCRGCCVCEVVLEAVVGAVCVRWLLCV